MFVERSVRWTEESTTSGRRSRRRNWESEQFKIVEFQNRGRRYFETTNGVRSSWNVKVLQDNN